MASSQDTFIEVASRFRPQGGVKAGFHIAVTAATLAATPSAFIHSCHAYGTTSCQRELVSISDITAVMITESLSHESVLPSYNFHDDSKWWLPIADWLNNIM